MRSPTKHKSAKKQKSIIGCLLGWRQAGRSTDIKKRCEDSNADGSTDTDKEIIDNETITAAGNLKQ